MKKTSVRRGLAWILILVMLLSAVPFGVFAEGAAPQEGTGETSVISVNAGEEKCLCKDRAKCTQEDFNKDCPVCSAEDADRDKCCEGKTPEQLTTDAEAKKTAEEEAAKKAAEEEAAKKPAAEEPSDSTASGPKTDANTNDNPATGNGDGETKDKTKDENGGTADVANDKNDQPATVTFHANAGGANNVTLPNNITSFRTRTVYLGEQKATRPGYIFKGWSTSEGADAAGVTSSITMNADNVDLYAVWERIKPTMVGDAIDVDITDGELNAILGENADTLTVKSGAVTDISKLLQKLELDENTDFKAVSVELLRNGDENKKLTELPSTLCFSMDVSSLNLNILQVQRNHNGWAPLPRLSAKPTDGQTEGYYLDGNTLYIYSKLFSTFAAYSAPYTVYFDAGDGEVSPKSATTDADGKLSSLPTPTRTGYTFDGWYVKNADGTETKVVEKETVFTDNAKVYAKWTAWTYTVIFDGNGGKVKNSVETSETVSAVYGSEVTAPEFVKEYYTVTGWARNADGTEKVGSPIKDLAASDGERITLYAQWEYAPRTVTFDANGVDGSGKATKGTVTEDGTEKPSVTRKTQESPINTLKTVPVPNAQEGYYFEGWYYKDRTGKEQPVEIGKTEFTADTTVYAKWKVFEPVTVTLKCQRGTMTVDGKSVSQGTMQTKWPGVLDGTLPTPARTGYKFQGWYTYAGVKVDENTVFLRDTTIYARWVSAVSRTGNPKTGDQIALEAAVAVLVLAAVGLGAAVIIKKKQNKK